MCSEPPSGTIIPSHTYTHLSQYAAFSTQNIRPHLSTTLSISNGFYGAPTPFTEINIVSVGNCSGLNLDDINIATNELTSLQYYLTSLITNGPLQSPPDIKTSKSIRYRLKPGIYYYRNGINFKNLSVYLDASGNSNAQFIFLTDSNNGITFNGTFGINLVNGTLPQNIIWYSSGGDITFYINNPIIPAYLPGTLISEHNIVLGGVTVNGCVYANKYIRTSLSSASIVFPSQAIIIDTHNYRTLSTYELLAKHEIISKNVVTVTNGNVGALEPKNINEDIVYTVNSKLDNNNVTHALNDVEKLYTKTLQLPKTNSNFNGYANHTSSNIGPGNYFSSNTIKVGDYANITLDGRNDSSSKFIFYAATSITFGRGIIITLINGAIPQNVLWIAGETITLSDGIVEVFSGSLVASSAITFNGDITVYGTVASTNGIIDFKGSAFVSLMSSPAYVPCYFKGTQILTDKGCVAIESLQEGDNIQTFAQITEKYEVVLHPAKLQKCISIKKFIVLNPRPSTGLICFNAGSLAENLPVHNLYVGPDHGIFIDGYLRVAKSFVNGTTIFYEQSCKKIEYYHILLDTYACVQANGLLSESSKCK